MFEVIDEDIANNKNLEDTKKEIEESNLPDSVKEVFKNYIEQSIKEPESGGGFFEGVSNIVEAPGRAVDAVVRGVIDFFR